MCNLGINNCLNFLIIGILLVVLSYGFYIFNIRNMYLNKETSKNMSIGCLISGLCFILVFILCSSHSHCHKKLSKRKIYHKIDPIEA